MLFYCTANLMVLKINKTVLGKEGNPCPSPETHVYSHPALPFVGRLLPSLRKTTRATHSKRPGCALPKPWQRHEDTVAVGALFPLPSSPGATRAGPGHNPPRPSAAMTPGTTQPTPRSPRALRAAAPARTLLPPPPVRDKVRSTHRVIHTVPVPGTISPFN